MFKVIADALADDAARRSRLALDTVANDMAPKEVCDGMLLYRNATHWPIWHGDRR